MKKEHVKSIVLTGLVGMNILLGSNILIYKKLWSSDYNFFNITNFPVLSLINKKSSVNENIRKNSHLTMPEKIIFNTGDQTTRFSLNSNNKEYAEIIEYCNEVLVAGLSNDETSIYAATEEEWFSSLMSESIYLSYYTEYNTELFAKFLGVSEPVLSRYVENFSDVVISLYDNVTIYVEDSKSGGYYKIKTGKKFGEFKETAEKIIASNAMSADSQDAINYSFDLNFDKTFGIQKTVISSMVPIYSNVQTVPVISATSPWSGYSDSLASNIKNDIVKAFNINTNNSNRYTEADGTTVYVENNATLKIHPDGLIEYKTRNNSLQPDRTVGRYAMISEVNELVAKINNIAKINDNMYISSGVGDAGDTITFDYICEGYPVKMAMNDMHSAVYCKVSEGEIKEYKHILRSYVKTDSTVTPPEYIFAVDDIIQKYSDVTQEVTINKLYLAYTDEGTDRVFGADWIADVKDIVLSGEG